MGDWRTCVAGEHISCVMSILQPPESIELFIPMKNILLKHISLFFVEEIGVSDSICSTKT